MSRSPVPKFAPRVAAEPISEEPDGLLLARFVAEKDAEAFEALIVRHGPRVLRKCREWVRDESEVEDAFQATFLVLVDRAATIRETASLGAWLARVAERVAGRARAKSDRRKAREGAIVELGLVADPTRDDLADLRPIVRAEVARLPEKYRRPIELCYWQGLSSDEAAESLRCPTGTVKWRLSRAGRSSGGGWTGWGSRWRRS